MESASHMPEEMKAENAETGFIRTGSPLPAHIFPSFELTSCLAHHETTRAALRDEVPLPLTSLGKRFTRANCTRE